MLQHLEALRDVRAVVIESDEEFVARDGEHASGGELECLVVGLGASERWVRGAERPQRSADRSLERDEPSELALQSERVVRDHRSRSRGRSFDSRDNSSSRVM
jgi:hypothetical protein